MSQLVKTKRQTNFKDFQPFGAFGGARWPHGYRRQCSEVAVPALVGSNPTEGGGFFRRKETPPGHGCVCMSSRG
jgi:hypothetical protein